MKKVTFISGNQNKADYLSKYLGYPVDHVSLDLDEIQSVDVHKIVEHKVRQAYDRMKKPVIVEDVSLEFSALGGLPGPFIKFFVERVSFESICAMIGDGLTRKAIARCVFGYFDGENLELFEGCLNGEISEKPEGDNGYDWDQIFIPEGYTVTRASLNKEDDKKTYLQIKPFAQLKNYLESK
ncbi:MAG: non-canonical purine NTP pyrophosphatase [Patescibacteria group bacterium]|nr:non-canonical purine NTP pyrophosphatase [Patescibacteria group bacterium]